MCRKILISSIMCTFYFANHLFNCSMPQPLSFSYAYSRLPKVYTSQIPMIQLLCVLASTLQLVKSNFYHLYSTLHTQLFLVQSFCIQTLQHVLTIIFKEYLQCLFTLCASFSRFKVSTIACNTIYCMHVSSFSPQ